MAKRIFENNAKEQKCQNGYLAKKSHFAILALLSMCIDFKNFFLPNDFSLNVMKDLLYTFAKKVSQAAYRVIKVKIRETKGLEDLEK